MRCNITSFLSRWSTCFTLDFWPAFTFRGLHTTTLYYWFGSVSLALPPHPPLDSHSLIIEFLFLFSTEFASALRFGMAYTAVELFLARFLGLQLVLFSLEPRSSWSRLDF